MSSTTGRPTLDPADPGDPPKPGIVSRFGGFVRRHWRWIVPTTAAGLAGLAWLAFGYFAVHLLWVDDRVDEEGPVFASGAAADTTISEEPEATTGDTGESADDTTTEPSDASPENPPDATAGAAPGETTTDGSSTTGVDPPDTTGETPAGETEGSRGEPGPVDGSSGPDTEPGAETPAGPEPEAEGGAEAPTPTPQPTPEPTPEVVTLFEGTFISRDHPGEGRAIVLNDGSEQRFLRFEDFATDNGPDLNVYLTASPADGPEGAFDDDFVDLGDLKGNIGSQNYEIPPDVDLERYSTVVVWCVRFASAFTAADLAPPG